MKARHVVENNKEDAGHFKLKPFLNLIGHLREKVTETLHFYNTYHKNPINQKVHTVCIPLLVWTAMVGLSSIPFPLTKNAANLLAIGYCLGYSFYDFKMGVSSAGFLAFFSYTAGLFSKQAPHANLAALILHGAAWSMQIYSHAKYEENHPAFLNSLLQSLYIAPLFSLIETCDFLGIKKSPLVTHSMLNQNRSSTPSIIVTEETQLLDSGMVKGS